MYKNRVLIFILVIVFSLGILTFTLGCNPPKAKQLKDFKASDLSRITLTRGAKDGKSAAEKTFEDEAVMQELLDVINSVTYTKGKYVFSGPKGKYRVLMVYKNDPNKGFAFEITSSDAILIGNYYYNTSAPVDLTRYDAFLD